MTPRCTFPGCVCPVNGNSGWFNSVHADDLFLPMTEYNHPFQSARDELALEAPKTRAGAIESSGREVG